MSQSQLKNAFELIQVTYSGLCFITVFLPMQLCFCKIVTSQVFDQLQNIPRNTNLYFSTHINWKKRKVFLKLEPSSISLDEKNLLKSLFFPKLIILKGHFLLKTQFSLNETLPKYDRISLECTNESASNSHFNPLITSITLISNQSTGTLKSIDRYLYKDNVGKSHFN